MVYGKDIELFGKIVNIKEMNVKLTGNESEEKIIKKYDEFYKKTAKLYIPQRVEYFEKIMNLKSKEIKFRKMKRRWGSCSKDKVLTFNTNLIKKDKNFIDEVIVHELTHLVHFNHSKDFYNHMRKYISSI